MTKEKVLIEDINDEFILSSSAVLEIQHECTSTYANYGFGFPGSFGTEVYTIAEFWKETSGTVLQTSTKTIRTETVLYDNTLSADGTLDTLGYDLSGYDDLKVELSARSVSTQYATKWTINNDTTDAHYTRIEEYYGTDAPTAAYTTSERRMGYIAGSDSPSGHFGIIQAYIPDYSGSNQKWINANGRSIRASTGYANLANLCWLSGSAITRIALTDTTGGNFAIGSRLRVIGIKNEPFVNAVSGEGSGTIVYPQRATMWHDEALAISGGAMAAAVISPQIFNTASVTTVTAIGSAFSHSFMLASGSYIFNVLGITSSNMGIIKWTFDGVDLIIDQDWYSGGVLNAVKTSSIVITGSGRHLLVGTTTGKNSSSSNYFIQLTKYWITPISDTTSV